MKKAFLYFVIAAGASFLLTVDAPASGWQWTRLIVAAIVQGFTAIKALQSTPDAPNGKPMPKP